MSTLPSFICEPAPSAPHSALWNPLPENRTAKRVGAPLPSLSDRRACFLVGLSSPQTGHDSIHGSAIVTPPAPRRKARREYR